MRTDIPASVSDAMNDYIALVNEAVPDLMAGLYLHGSLALGAFNPGLSDIDFITLTHRRSTDADLAALRSAHHELAKRHPEAHLSGSYLERRDIGQPEAGMPPHPFFHDGVFHTSGHHDINGVTWWVLKHHGIALLGPEPEHLDIHVDWLALLEDMHHNMDTYWASFTTNPRRILWLLDDYGIQWAVLGVLRQFYTFRERAITSKVGAGHYALDHLPARWHQLIREAIDIREGMRASSYRSRITRALSAYAFLSMIITACRSE